LDAQAWPGSAGSEPVAAAVEEASSSGEPRFAFDRPIDWSARRGVPVVRTDVRRKLDAFARKEKGPCWE
jgi:hypothetical protein